MAPRIADHQLRQGLFILNAWRSSLRNSSDLATSSLQQLQQQLHLNLQSPLHDVVIGYLFDDCTTKASKQCSPSSKTTERVLRRPIWVRTLMTQFEIWGTDDSLKPWKKIMLNKLGTSSWSWEPTILFRIATTALWRTQPVLGTRLRWNLLPGKEDLVTQAVFSVLR
jgi:hypothetical protein